MKEGSEQDEKELETASKASSVFEKDRTLPPEQEPLNASQEEPVVADGPTEEVASPKSPKRLNSREVPAAKSPRETPELKRGPSRTGSITPNSKAARQSPVAKSSPTPIATPVASTPSLLHPALHGEFTFSPTSFTTPFDQDPFYLDYNPNRTEVNLIRPNLT